MRGKFISADDFRVTGLFLVVFKMVLKILIAIFRWYQVIIGTEGNRSDMLLFSNYPRIVKETAGNVVDSITYNK